MIITLYLIFGDKRRYEVFIITFALIKINELF